MEGVLYLFRLYQLQKAVKRVYSNESGSDTSNHANVIVIGPIPTDNTNSGKSLVSREKGWKLRIYGCVFEGYITCVFVTTLLFMGYI